MRVPRAFSVYGFIISCINRAAVVAQLMLNSLSRAGRLPCAINSVHAARGPIFLSSLLARFCSELRLFVLAACGICVDGLDLASGSGIESMHGIVDPPNSSAKHTSFFM